MAKNIQVLVNTGNSETNKTFEVIQGSGAKGKPTTIKAVKGARYQLEELTAKSTGPENIRSKRVGKNLHVMLEGSNAADLIVENYYDEDMLTENNRGLYGRAEDGKMYEYIPEDPTPEGLPINLADGGRPVSQVLGGLQIGEAFELSGLVLAAAGGGFGLLGAGAAAVGAAALAGGGGGGTTNGGSGNNGDDTMTGGNGNDTMSGGNGNDSMDGGDGNDTMDGGDDNDSMTGGNGDDSLSGGNGNDTMFGNNGNDSMNGGNGEDTMSGGNGNDTMNGGDGNDTMDGGDDNDSMNGGDGNDSMSGGNGTDTMDGGEGNDSMNGGDGNDSMSGGNGTDTMDGGEGNDSMNGGDGNDSMSGGNGTDTMDGGNGDDSMNGGDGNDSMSGGNGTDTMDGGEGNDSMNGGDGNDSMSGGNGNDTMDGGNGDDSMSGGNGDDSMFGGNGNDTMDGGQGNDTIDGGDGFNSLDISKLDEAVIDKVKGTVTFKGTDGQTHVTTFKNIDQIIDNGRAVVTVTAITDDTGTGVGATDFVTKDHTLVYSGTVTPAADTVISAAAHVKVELLDAAGQPILENGKPVTAIVPVAANGTWSWDRTGVNQVDGDYTLRATVVDAAGVRFTSNPLKNVAEVADLTTDTDPGVDLQAVKIDNSVPTVTIKTIMGDAVGDTGNGTYDTAERAAATDPTITGTTTNVPKDGTGKVNVTLNGITYVATVGADGTWTATVSKADALLLNHGNIYDVFAVATNGNGNTGIDSNNKLVVNVATVDVPTVNNLKTNTTSPTLTGTAQKLVNGAAIALESTDTITVTVNGKTYTGTVSNLPKGLSYNATAKTWSLDTSKVATSAGLAQNTTYEVVVSVTSGTTTVSDTNSTNELQISNTAVTIAVDPISGGYINASEKNELLNITGATNAQVGAKVTINLGGVDYTGFVTAPGKFVVSVPAASVAALADNTYTAKASVTNEFGNSANDTETVTVDTALPTFSSADTASVLENIPAGTEIYDANASDTNTLKYSLKAGVGDDADSFTIDPVTGKVLIVSSPNFETKSSYTFTVVATDAAGNKTEKPVTLAINNVNEAPTGANAIVDMNEGTSKTFAAADFGFADASDAPANALSAVIITTLPTAGTLKLNGTAVTAGQSIAAADLGKLVYAPAANGNGSAYATIGFKVQDNGGTANGGVDTSVADSTLTINVAAVNDAPLNTVPAAQTVAEDTQLSLTGISVNDVDGNIATTKLTVLHGNLNVDTTGGATISAGANGSSTLTLNGTQVQINAALASLKYQGTANYNGTDTLTVLTTDSQGLNDSDTVAITVSAVADNASITGSASGAVTEDDASKNTATGTLTVSDPDTGDNVLQTPSNLSGTYGSFALNPTTGVWTYTLDNTKGATQALKAGEQKTDTLTVTSKDGSASQAITVTITGANDVAVISGSATGDLTEDNATTVASGTLTVTDVDTGEAAFQTPSSTALAGTYGNFAFNTATGVWTYTLDNSKAATNALNTGDTVYDTVTVKSADGTGTQEIKVTIHGANEIVVNHAPVGSGTAADDVITTDLLGAASVPATGFSAFTGNGPFTFGTNTATVSGNLGVVTDSTGWANSAGGFRIGDAPNLAETVSMTFAQSVSKVEVAFTGMNNDGTTSNESLKIFINGSAYKLTAANIKNFYFFSGGTQTVTTPVINAAGELVNSQTGAVGYFQGTLVIDASTVAGGINGIGITDKNSSDGITAKVTVFDASATASKTVTELFGGAFTDTDTSDTFRGVTITSAGSSTDATNLGKYQYQKAGTTTWVDLPTGLTDSTAVFLAAADSVRFVASTANTNAFAKPDLVARLVDSSATTAPVTGAVIDVSAANHGGSTAYSGDTVTLHSTAEVNAAPVANPTTISNAFAATATAPEVTITDDQASASVANGTTITYTLNFSQAIADGSLTASDISIVGGGTGGTLTKVSATQYTYTVTAAAGTTATGITLADGSYTSASGVAGLGSSATQSLAVTAVAGPEITGTAGRGNVPAGWSPSVTGTGTNPDLIDVNFTDANIYLSTINKNVTGTSANGGTFETMVMTATQTEAITTNLTGLIVGQTYTFGVQWQQMVAKGYSGGSLKITAGTGATAVSQTYTSTGIADDWNNALITFKADATTMAIDLRNGDARLGMTSGATATMIAVDSLTAAQIEAAALQVNGTLAGDIFVGRESAETFNIAYLATTDATGTDKVYAGAGNDTVIFNSFNAGVMNVDGGSGVNFLQLASTATATTLDLTDAAVRARVHNFNSFDMTGSAANTLKLNWAAVAALSGATDVSGTAADESKMVVVSGNTGDTLNLVNLTSWSVGATQTAADLTTIYGSAYNFLSGHTYKAYTLNGATVFVDQALTVATTTSTTASVAYSQAVTIDSLFAASFTDGNTASTETGTFKGVAITAAGTVVEVANTGTGALGHYELSKDGGVTWTAVAGGLTDSTAVYADKTALIRYAGATGVEVIKPQALTVRLIDNSGLTSTSALTPASTGTTLDAHVNGGTTAFSANTVVMNALAPVVLDMNHDGVMSYSNVVMDVDGDGHLDTTKWAGAQDGVLVLDKYADGKVHDNSQYAFSQYGAAGSTDLQGLAAGFDSNHDGVLDAKDAKFAEFKVWQDANQNGVSDAGEVRSLSEAGITSINLVSDGVVRHPVDGVTEAGQSSAALADGSSMLVSDAGFAYSALAYSADTVAGLGAHIDLLGANMNLDLSSLVAAHHNVVAVDLSGTGANSLKLNLSDVLGLPTTDGMHTLTLTGDANDTVNLDMSQWANSGNTVTQGEHTYAVYNASSAAAAQLLIDQHMVLANHG